MLIKSSSGVSFKKDWDLKSMCQCYMKGLFKYNSPNSSAVDAVLLDNQLQKLKNRVDFKMGRKVVFDVVTKIGVTS